MEENRDLAKQGKRLTTISREVPVTLDLEASRIWDYDRSKVTDLLRELEFFSMVSRIPGRSDEDVQQLELGVSHEHESKPTDYKVVDTEESLDEMIASLAASKIFSFDTETTSKNAMAAELVGFSFSNQPGRGWYVPVGHEEGKQLPLEQVLDKVSPLLASEEIGTAAHNANYDMTVLGNYNVQVRNLKFDTMLAAHLSGRKAIGLKALALECLHEEMTPITDLIGTGRKQITMAQVPIDKSADYATARRGPYSTALRDIQQGVGR